MFYSVQMTWFTRGLPRIWNTMFPLCILLQCTNDVVHERFASDLKYDVALRLAALHIQQHYSASHAVAKLNLKNLE